MIWNKEIMDNLEEEDKEYVMDMMYEYYMGDVKYE